MSGSPETRRLALPLPSLLRTGEYVSQSQAQRSLELMGQSAIKWGTRFAAWGGPAVCGQADGWLL